MLREGVLTQGTRLPPERELAAHFNVARSSLRQALKVLEIMGIITQKVGDGSYLNTDTLLSSLFRWSSFSCSMTPPLKN